jgi:hypothetical protein
VTRWPRRAKPLPPDMPVPLRSFVEADWQAWLLDGPDPGSESYKDGDSSAFYARIAGRPELVACWRRRDAHQRWSAARCAWLKERGHDQLAFNAWLDDLAYEHQVIRGEIREAAG